MARRLARGMRAEALVARADGALTALQREVIALRTGGVWSPSRVSIDRCTVL